MELETWKANNNGKLTYGAISSIVPSKAAALAWLTKPIVQNHLQKLNQAGKASNSLVQLHLTMTLNNSQSLAGYTSSIFTLTTNSSLNIQLTRCKRDLLTQRERRHATYAIEKDDIVDLALVLKAWDEYFTHIATNQKAVAEQGWVHWKTDCSSIRKFNWQVWNLQTEANNNQPVSFIPPCGLNLCQGFTGTLVDHVVQYRNHKGC